MAINEKQMVIYDADGNEKTVEILFTYTSEESGYSYVLFYEPENDEEVIAMRYTEEGELQEIESDEEFAEIEEVYNAYLEDLK